MLWGNNEICLNRKEWAGGWRVGWGSEETYSSEVTLEVVLGNPPAREKVEAIGFWVEGLA